MQRKTKAKTGIISTARVNSEKTHGVNLPVLDSVELL